MNTTTATPSAESLLRMWNTRPVRPNADGTVAGVCAGIARRYRVDPTLVKIAFVVATLFGGSGVIMYVLAWITLPAGDDAPSEYMNRGERKAVYRRARAEYRRARREHRHGRRPDLDGARHRSHPPTIVLIVIAVIVVTSFTPNIAWSSGGLLGAALMLLGWWLLYQRSPDAEPGTSADTIGTAPIVATETFTRWVPKAWADNVTAATASGVSTPDAPGVGDAPTVPTERVDLEKPIEAPPGPPTPPAWDPLGAAPFAWDLPEPSVAPAPAPMRRRSALTPITLGVALLAAAGAATAAFAGVGALTPARIAALALGVVCIGLLIGAVTRRGPGLVPVAVILAVVVVFTSAASGLGSLPGGGVGDRDWRPVTESDIDPSYELTVGSATLDLRSVSLTGNRSVRLRVGLGEAVVLAPAGMNLKVRCRTTIGDETCRTGLDGGSDGPAGPVLDIDASSIVGHVEVGRG
ncbi:PspC domain-containing protein [Williamsia maris]|uniref:PspC domain-containing protein n=1 Tax=Williamsia maris TaxID=72806 RepID=UPI0020A3AA1D|nr:PspC domain-containing protein [Williamsia maris]